MRKIFKRVQNEDGALSIEFLGILPFFFLLFIILWQVVASGYAIYTLKTAANEGAKVYALTEDKVEAENTIIEIIGGTTVLVFKDSNVEALGAGKFKLKLEASHPLIFVPDKWKPSTSISLNESITSRVLTP
ncbi:TadE/TadG family type IV pilus assembly protein [Bacillaceae bacterium W0354]